MADDFIQLSQRLEDRGISARSYLAYLFERAKVLIEESNDAEAIQILKDSGDLSNVTSKIDHYAEECENVFSEDPKYYCNNVFLLYLKINDYFASPSTLALQQVCDEYSGIVDSIDGEYEADIREIDAHFRSDSNENSTFTGVHVAAAIALQLPGAIAGFLEFEGSSTDYLRELTRTRVRFTLKAERSGPRAQTATSASRRDVLALNFRHVGERRL